MTSVYLFTKISFHIQISFDFRKE